MRILGLLLVAGVVEIAVLVALGHAIGVLPTIALLIATAALGSWLLRREGRRTLQEFTEAVRLRRPADKEISDGMLLAAAGLLIMLPGLISSVVGLLLLVAPVRSVVRTRMIAAAEKRARQAEERLHREQVRREHGDFVDGEVITVEDDQPAPRRTYTVLPPRSVQAERLDRPAHE